MEICTATKGAMNQHAALTSSSLQAPVVFVPLTTYSVSKVLIPCSGNDQQFLQMKIFNEKNVAF